jgi:hypothetical protein
VSVESSQYSLPAQAGLHIGITTPELDDDEPPEVDVEEPVLEDPVLDEPVLDELLPTVAPLVDVDDPAEPEPAPAPSPPR